MIWYFRHRFFCSIFFHYLTNVPTLGKLGVSDRHLGADSCADDNYSYFILYFDSFYLTDIRWHSFTLLFEYAYTGRAYEDSANSGAQPVVSEHESLWKEMF